VILPSKPDTMLSSAVLDRAGVARAHSQPVGNSSAATSAWRTTGQSGLWLPTASSTAKQVASASVAPVTTQSRSLLSVESRSGSDTRAHVDRRRRQRRGRVLAHRLVADVDDDAEAEADE
jgi:hypothetical protein